MFFAGYFPMKRLSRVVTLAGAASVGVGLFALLDAYWRWIGVALGYPPGWSGSVGSGLLLAGIVCLLASRQTTTPGAYAPGRVPEATHDELS
jgi:hypothetical protein